VFDTDRTFIIAEAGCNHECDMDVAKRMIKAAHNVGADAIKFQTYKAEKLVAPDAIAYWGTSDMRQLDYYKQLDKFGREEYAELFKYAEEVGIVAFSTPFDEESATMLAELGVPIMKIASCEVTNLGLVKHIASLGLPVIMSTGGCYPQQVMQAVSLLDNVDLMLMACTLSNPATEACVGRVRTLQTMYPYTKVGYSDHTDPDRQVVPMLAVAAGAKAIEKHFTIDKSMNISNHFFAADIYQMKELVYYVREAEKYMGDYQLTPVFEELKPRRSAARSWYTARPVSKGAKFVREDLVYLRPGDGYRYNELDTILGATAKTRLNANVMLSEDDLEYEVI
jgi:sialic acid synthase SpsE